MVALQWLWMPLLVLLIPVVVVGLRSLAWCAVMLWGAMLQMLW